MKGNTATAQQSRDISQQKLTIGLDLGDQEVFSAMPRSRVALETGTHLPWISRLLSGLGHEAIVAHARNVRLIGERLQEGRLFGGVNHGRGWPESIPVAVR
jgi:hypothetical protein